MKSIEVINSDVYVSCPNCKDTESLGIDEQRHHLGCFEIVKWYDDSINGNEVSMMSCNSCKAIFQLEWNYNNKINSDE